MELIFRPFEWAIQDNYDPFILSYTQFVKDTIESKTLKVRMDDNENPGVWKGGVKLKFHFYN